MALLTALVALLATGALAYLPHDAGPKLQAVHFAQDHYISDALLREVVDRMGKDLAEAADSYMDFPGGDPRMPLMSRAAKDLESEQFDYDSLSDGNPNPSLRDQEYLQHSTLWGQYVNGPGSEGSHVKPGHAGRPPQQLKADAALPAYCNPPNPCPVGYTEEQGCTLNFENTAAFSREYQSEQECMCDGEHMFECPGAGGDGGEGGDGGMGGLARGEDSPSARLDYFLARQLKMDQHKNLVAKKFHAKKSVNPYLDGEKLPVAAKKGINVDLNMD